MSSDEEHTVSDKTYRKTLEISLFPLLQGVNGNSNNNNNNKTQLNNKKANSNSNSNSNNNNNNNNRKRYDNKLPKIVSGKISQDVSSKVSSKMSSNYTSKRNSNMAEDSDSQLSDYSDIHTDISGRESAIKTKSHSLVILPADEDGFKTIEDSYYNHRRRSHSKSSFDRRMSNSGLTSPRIIKAHTKLRVKNRIRTSFNTEHEFLERELYDVKRILKKFRSKYLCDIKLDDENNANEKENLKESDVLDYLKDMIKSYEKKSKNLKLIEIDILRKENTTHASNQIYLDYLKKSTKFKHKNEQNLLVAVDRLKDLYYEHISKCCCNFYTNENDQNGVKYDSNGNQVIIEENINESDNEAPATNTTKTSTTLTDGKLLGNLKSKNNHYTEIMRKYDKLVKQFKDNCELEIKELNRLVSKQNSYADSFYTYIRMRHNYVNLSEDILKRSENLLKLFFEWTREDRKFLENLTECIDYMQRESREKDSKRVYLQTRLSLVEKRLNKFNKQINLLRYKQNQYRRYSDQLLKRDELINIQCDRLLYKISNINLEIKAFDQTWNNAMYTRYETSKHQFAKSKEKKLHVVLNRLHTWLDNRRAEQRKIRKTIKNITNAIQLIDVEIKGKCVEQEPAYQDFEKYSYLNKQVSEDITRFNMQANEIQKARKLKLSMKSYLNLQAGLLPSLEQV